MVVGHHIFVHTAMRVRDTEWVPLQDPMCGLPRQQELWSPELVSKRIGQFSRAAGDVGLRIPSSPSRLAK